MVTATAQARLTERASKIVEEELKAWAITAADVRNALATAQGRALHGGAFVEWRAPSTTRERAEQCGAYLLRRIERELGQPIDAIEGRRALDLLENGLR